MVNAKETTSVWRKDLKRECRIMIEFKKAIKVPEIFADLILEFARILTDSE